VFSIVEADLSLPEHAAAVLLLMEEYARDPMGGGKGLSEFARTNLVEAMRKRSDVRVVLAWDGGKPVGLANCIEGFSSFACKPLLNIHDLVVTRSHRGRGIALLMLEKVEEIAARTGCCKLTLEVLEGNQTAQAAYRKFGFQGYELDPRAGRALFWEKKLS
jgi:ribosomal protein S18 acetylase RimI-like enzyme